jgi:hypothetical protein
MEQLQLAQRFGELLSSVQLLTMTLHCECSAMQANDCR